MTQSIEELRKQLLKAEKEELGRNWDNSVSKLRKLGEFAKGKTFIQFSGHEEESLHGFIRVLKVTDFKETYYADQSGFNGQFDKRRWIVIKGIGFSLDSFYNEISLNCGKGAHRAGLIPITGKYRTLDEQNEIVAKFLNIGKVRKEVVEYNVGQNAYKNNDFNSVDRVIGDFLSRFSVAPDGVFEMIEDAYHQQTKIVHNLRQKLFALKIQIEPISEEVLK